MKTSYFTKLSGTSFEQASLAQVKPGSTKLRLVPRPDNEYDKFAVEVQALLDSGWSKIGWIQKGKNEEIQKHLLDGFEVKVECTEVTGADKETLGCNVSIEYDDSGLDPADMRDFERQNVVFGDAEYVYFDTVNHKAYDKLGHELLSGSRAEHLFLPDLDLRYAAKALSKSTGAKVDDIMALWDIKRDLAADQGTLIHEALEKYLKYSPVMKQIDENKEREHTAKNWMPEVIGEIVDKFVEASGLKECSNVEVRVKSGTRTGIIDCLLIDEVSKRFTIYDYKVTSEIKEVKYRVFGKKSKYTIQQNFYREILEDLGCKCDGLYLWQWDGKEWSKHKLEIINVKDNL